MHCTHKLSKAHEEDTCRECGANLRGDQGAKRHALNQANADCAGVAPGSQTLTIYDDRQARRRPIMGPSAVREFRWGADTVIIGGVIHPRSDGVSNTLVMVGDQGGPARMRWHDERRYPNQGWTCVGCPHFGIRGREMYCAHPLYLELFECPQYRGSLLDVGADRECPMLARRTEAAQRRYRWHCKSSDIFWRYYHDSKLNPYKHGFAWIYPMHRLGPVNEKA